MSYLVPYAKLGESKHGDLLLSQQALAVIGWGLSDSEYPPCS